MINFDYRADGKAYITLKKQFKICENGLFKGVAIFPNIIRGV